jgi:hypothetical protein
LRFSNGGFTNATESGNAIDAAIEPTATVFFETRKNNKNTTRAMPA